MAKSNLQKMACDFREEPYNQGVRPLAEGSWQKENKGLVRLR